MIPVDPIQARLALRDIAMAHSVAAVEALAHRQRVEDIPAAKRAQIKSAARHFIRRPSRMDDPLIVRGACFLPLDDLLARIEIKILRYANREWDQWRLPGLRGARLACRYMRRLENREARLEAAE